ncbi:MAG: META domain-containing protein [Reyranella sp.]|nr:MAG: META domain-containing protein [Reyranella sp.]TBR27990.1 MAG: META domain-containing protein [Reyranella sp.]
MKRLPLLLLLAASAAAAQVSSSDPRPSPMPAPRGEVMYSCPGGMDFASSFSDDGDQATLRMPGQPDIDLSRVSAGSGFAYSDSYYELRGRGREVTLTAAGRSMRCHAAGRPGDPPRTYEGGGLTVTLFPDGTFRLREKRDGSTDPLLDLGEWAQEVEGGVRLVLRGGAGSRRAFREIGTDKLVADDGSELAQAATPDPIDGRFRLSGMYRDAQDGGLFAPCLVGRTYGVAPGGAEPELEKAWVDATPSRETSLYVEIIGGFDGNNSVTVDRFLGLKRGGACPALASRGSALRDTEWRLVELDGERPAFEDWRRRPLMRLDDLGKFTASTGCNTMGGDYVLDPAGLRFTPGPMTMMACAPAEMAIEKRFLAALDAIRTAQISGTTLDLIDAAGKRRMRLEARGS